MREYWALKTMISLTFLALCSVDAARKSPDEGPVKIIAYTPTNSSGLLLLAPDNGFSIDYYGTTTNFTTQLYVDLERYPGAKLTGRMNKTEVAEFEGVIILDECDTEYLSNYSKSMMEFSDDNNIDQTNNYTTARAVGFINGTNLANLTCFQVHMAVKPVFLGLSKAIFSLQYTDPETGNETRHIADVLFTCLRNFRAVDWIFQIVIYTMVGAATFGMGTDMSIPTIKKHMKKPKAPLIALFSQYTLMPLLSYAVIRLANLKGGFAMGLFLLGSSPGGGLSNMFSKLLNGDVSISVTMTVISTFASIALLPFWVYTLGSVIPGSDELGKINIPYLALLQSSVIIIFPVLLGLLIQYKLPKLAKIIKKGLNVLFLIIIIFIFSAGVYSNLFAYVSLNAKLVFSVALMPYGGFLCGGILAWAIRLNWKLIKTISIETGLQNVGVALLVLQASMKSPHYELASIPILAAMLMTAIPLYIAIPPYMLYQKFKKKKEEEEESDEEAGEKSSENKENGGGSESGSSNRQDDETKRPMEQEMDEIPELTKLV